MVLKKEKRKLNLGCGNDIRKDFVNVDQMKIPGVDVVCDINAKKLPFENDTFEVIMLNHILEHIQNLEALLKELYRVSKNGGRILIRVPYFSHESAFSHYQHIRRFTWTTFDLFDPNHTEHFHTDIKFKVVKKELRSRFFGSKTPFNLFPRLYQEYLCWIFPVKEIYYELEVLK